MNKNIWRRFKCSGLLLLVLVGTARAVQASQPSDPLLELLIQKGMLTQDEANRVRAEAEAIRTNAMENLQSSSKWKLSNGIKNIELFGDLRVRYEHRQGNVPDGRLELDRGRGALRVGLRGDAFDDFYYGLRVDSSSNPRSPWVTFGTSSGGVPYYGPYGKSTFGLDMGQIYIGWKPTSWMDLTVGKIANPMFTTPMVWDTDISPEGAVERFKYNIGQAEFFATLGQFVYQDVNPSYASGGLGFNGLLGQERDTPFQLAWQGGVNYHFTTNVSAKVAATVYNYIGLQTNVAPFFGDAFVGEGAYTGKGTANAVNGAAGYGGSGSLPGYGSFGYPNNQVGLDHLLVLEIPAEINFKIGSLNARVFGDFSYNLEGGQRADAAAAGYAAYLAAQNATIQPFAPQRHDVKAYQGGIAIGSKDSLGLVYGTTSRRHAWEFRTYWQHVEQYALDPNLLDSDFFEGRGNLQGMYCALAYGFTDNVIATFRYGYAWRINDLIGTGGSNLDMPQVNPIDHYHLLQLDLTMRF